MKSVIEDRAMNISCTLESCLSFGLVTRGLSKHTEGHIPRLGVRDVLLPRILGKQMKYWMAPVYTKNGKIREKIV